MTRQRQLDFTPGGDSEDKRARCQRLLSRLGDKRIVKASRLFTAQAHREAEQRCQAANRRIRENLVQLQETKST